MDKLIELLEENDIEVTDDLKNEIQEVYPEEVNTDDPFTQDNLNDVVKKRLARQEKLHEQEIQELKDEMEGLVDPDKVEEYESKIEELEGEADKRESQLKKDYELQLAATEAGVKDQEYFDFLVEKKGLKNRLTTDDDGSVVATDEDGNIMTEDGKKLGPSALVNEIKEEKSDVFGEKEEDGEDIGGGGNPGGGPSKDVQKNTESLATELGYKTKDKE